MTLRRIGCKMGTSKTKRYNTIGPILKMRKTWLEISVTSGRSTTLHNIDVSCAGDRGEQDIIH